MPHFIVYHNPGQMGVWQPSADYFAVTKKSVDGCIGARAWLISREGKARNYNYILCATFVVERAGPNHSGIYANFPNIVTAKDGKRFDPPIQIDKREDWFQRLFRTTQHFRTGLTHVREQAIVDGLSGLGEFQ